MGLYRNGRKIAGASQNGKSAYEYAIEGGYKGTIDEFYSSLGNIDIIMNIVGDVQNLKSNSIFAIRNITLTHDMFTDNSYTLENPYINTDSISNTYYSPESMEVVKELGIYEETIDGGIKFVIQNPKDSFTIDIDVVLIMNIGYNPDDENDDVEGTDDVTLLDKITVLEKKVTALTSALGGCSFEVIDSVPHVVFENGEVKI